MRAKGKASRNEGGSPSEEKVRKDNKTISLFFFFTVFFPFPSQSLFLLTINLQFRSPCVAP